MRTDHTSSPGAQRRVAPVPGGARSVVANRWTTLGRGGEHGFMSSVQQSRRFAQVDVFSSKPLRGNPVAVVVDGDGISDDDMAAFARWTNLSETTFIQSPTDPAADYRLRIFTPGGELPFAGHPTLGSAHAWLAAGGSPRGANVVQECGVGPVSYTHLTLPTSDLV